MFTKGLISHIDHSKIVFKYKVVSPPFAPYKIIPIDLPNIAFLEGEYTKAMVYM